MSERLSRSVLAEGLPKGICLNVNFPKTDSFLGLKVCRMGYGSWVKEVVRCTHPRGLDYYWMVGKYLNTEPQKTDTDQWALDHGYVCVTPVTIDVTDYNMLRSMKDWED